MSELKQMENMQINFSSQNFSVEHNFFYTYVRKNKRFDFVEFFLHHVEKYIFIFHINFVFQMPIL
jgi:hypothetical protein